MAGTSVEHGLNISVERVTEWKKRKSDEDPFREVKRPRQWFYRLESESSVSSEGDTESIYSIQNQETDIARDTSDTDSKSESDNLVDFEVEYDVASLSENEEYPIFGDSSSDTEDFFEGAIAAAICETSLDTWVTDNDTSDNSSMDELDFGRTEFGICVQCKSRNDNPYYRYCERCFQARKLMFPPRPRARSRRRAYAEKKKSEVKLATLQSCLSGLSQDSGLGSSQEIQALEFDQIVVPDHLKSSLESDLEEAIDKSGSEAKDSNSTTKNAATPTSSSDSGKPSDTIRICTLKRKREDENDLANASGSALNKFKKQKVDNNESENASIETENSDAGDTPNDLKSEVETVKDVIKTDVDGVITQKGQEKGLSLADSKELCIMCNCVPKNSIFLHGSIAHMCCCYKCAMRTWRTNKRCPICNCKVRNVVKVFTT